MTGAYNQPVVCSLLIGRADEIAVFHKRINEVISCSGQVALLCGEAGIGKSRLVAEIKAAAITQGFQSLQGHCFPGDRSCPYAPVLDLLRTVFLHTDVSQLGTFIAPFARELFHLLPEITQLFPDVAHLSSLPTLDPEQEKRRIFAVLARFFLSQAEVRPLLLVVEDIHWGDDISLEFLLYLARHCAGKPLLILLTYRSDEISPSLSHWLAQVDRERLAQEIVLTPFTRSETDTMLQTIFALQRSVQEETLDAIYTLTEGNPFFIEESLKALVVAGEISPAQVDWDRKPPGKLHIPRSIQDSVQQRAQQVSESARYALHLAAVAGRRFDFALLQQVTQHDGQHLLELMKELIAAQLVVEESTGQFAFRHALTRQALYAELLAQERKLLHRTIGETMENLYATELDTHLEDLAYHFYEAGVWEKAFQYAQTAGEKAQRMYAPRAALEHFTRAWEAAHQLHHALPPRFYHERGQVYDTLGKFEQACSDYERALAIAHESHNGLAEWQSLLDLGFLWTGRDYQRAGDYYQQALALARSMDDAATLAHSLNRLGNWHLNAEQPSEALRCHQEALVMFGGLHDRHGLAETLDLLGIASYLNGDLIQSALYYEQAIAHFRELDERERLPNSLATLMCCGGMYQTETLIPMAMDFADARARGELAVKIAGEIGSRSDEAYALIRMGVYLGPRGEYARALEVAQRGLAIAQDIEHRQWMTAGHCALGALYLDLLAFAEAKPHLEQALALAQQIGSRRWTRIVPGFLARVLLAQHDVAQAESLLDAALGPDDPTQTIGQRMVWYARAELALARNDPPLALRITDQLLASAVGLSSESNIPHLATLRGEALTKLEQAAEAETILHGARTTALKRGLRPLLWRNAIDLGNLYHAQRRFEEAEHAFATAEELIEEIAGTIPDTELRAYFLQQATALLPHRELLSPRRAAKRAFGGLTERESEVAVLIAQGKSNREIADSLTVTERTVETHVRNILNKLDLTSRIQIALWVITTGLTDNVR
jgi:tetratricopeptide (TPR) repeat protein